MSICCKKKDQEIQQVRSIIDYVIEQLILIKANYKLISRISEPNGFTKAFAETLDEYYEIVDTFLRREISREPREIKSMEMRNYSEQKLTKLK
jgi:hypothetical protein